MGNGRGRSAAQAPYLIVTVRAQADFQRCRDLLSAHNPRAAAEAANAIFERLSLLRDAPEIGRRVPGRGSRELLIPYGNSGYVALYRFEPEGDEVQILAIRHQSEVGY